MELLLLVPIGIALIVGWSLFLVFMELAIYAGVVLVGAALVIELLKAVF